MNKESLFQNSCPQMKIAEFLDGELLLREELELEVHVENCRICRAELNSQKRLLGALDSSDRFEREFVLPENFTQTIVANAESSVKGLRRARERFNALLICSALFLLLILGLGAESTTILTTVEDFFHQAVTFVNLFIHFFYDFALIITVIMRSLCGQFIFRSESVSGLLFVLLAVSAFVLVRLMSRFKRI